MTQKRHVKLRFKSYADAEFAERVAGMLKMDLAGLANFAVQKVINDVVQQYQKRKEEEKAAAEAEAKEIANGPHDTVSTVSEGTPVAGQLEDNNSAALPNQEADAVDPRGA